MKKNKSLLLSGPYILFMVIFTLIPLGVVGYYALTDPDTGAFTFRNIQELANYGSVLWESIITPWWQRSFACFWATRWHTSSPTAPLPTKSREKLKYFVTVL